MTWNSTHWVNECGDATKECFAGYMRKFLHVGRSDMCFISVRWNLFSLKKDPCGRHSCTHASFSVGTLIKSCATRQRASCQIGTPTSPLCIQTGLRYLCVILHTAPGTTGEEMISLFVFYWLRGRVKDLLDISSSSLYDPSVKPVKSVSPTCLFEVAPER